MESTSHFHSLTMNLNHCLRPWTPMIIINRVVTFVVAFFAIYTMLMSFETESMKGLCSVCFVVKYFPKNIFSIYHDWFIVKIGQTWKCFPLTINSFLKFCKTFYQKNSVKHFTKTLAPPHLVDGLPVWCLGGTSFGGLCVKNCHTKHLKMFWLNMFSNVKCFHFTVKQTESI